MAAQQNPSLPKIGSEVTTACKGLIYYEATTPNVIYHGRRIYFCLSSCLKAFQEDPKTSCLDSDHLAQKKD